MRFGHSDGAALIHGWVCVIFLASCAQADLSPLPRDAKIARGDENLIVTCELQPLMYGHGSFLRLETPQPVKSTIADCQKQGGRFITDKRASLGVWLEAAQRGNVDAMFYAAQILETTQGAAGDAADAVGWYERAAGMGSRKAMMALATMYESGNGVTRNMLAAANWYRQATGLADVKLVDAREMEKWERYVAEIDTLKAEVLHVRLETDSASVDSGITRQSVEAARRKLQQASTSVVTDPVQPALVLISPPLTKAESGEAIMWDGRTPITVKGRAYGKMSQAQVRVADRVIATDDYGWFEATLSPSQLANVQSVTVALETERRPLETIQFRLSRSPISRTPAQAASRKGQLYAVLIGNAAYDAWPPLPAAKRDVDALAELLHAKYGFETKLIYNASKDDVLRELVELLPRLHKEDSLLLYFGGHGMVNPRTFRGFWIPREGERFVDVRWINNVDVTDHLFQLRAGSILVISDACFSGTFASRFVVPVTAGSVPATSEKGDAAPRVSRTILTGGDWTLVYEPTKGEHSFFARALLDALRENQRSISVASLAKIVSARVDVDVRRAGQIQIPQYWGLPQAGHEGGDFILSPQ